MTQFQVFASYYTINTVYFTCVAVFVLDVCGLLKKGHILVQDSNYVVKKIDNLFGLSFYNNEPEACLPEASCRTALAT